MHLPLGTYLIQHCTCLVCMCLKVCRHTSSSEIDTCWHLLLWHCSFFREWRSSCCRARSSSSSGMELISTCSPAGVHCGSRRSCWDARSSSCHLPYLLQYL